MNLRFLSPDFASRALLALLALPAAATAQPPAGVRVRLIDPPGSASVLIPWGSTHKDVERALSPKGAKRPTWRPPLLSCDGDRCEMSYEWHADLGPDRIFAAPVLFVGKRGLYRFGLAFGADDFDFVRAAIVSALGEPDTETSGVAKTVGGAELTSNASTWETEAFEVSLSARLVRVDHGALMVTWKELAPVKIEDRPKAPF